MSTVRGLSSLRSTNRPGSDGTEQTVRAGITKEAGIPELAKADLPAAYEIAEVVNSNAKSPLVRPRMDGICDFGAL